MLSRAVVCCCCCAWLWAAGSSSAEAGPWPGRAGGESSSGDPELLLTFDDGPHEKHTRRILDTLDEHGLKAIFFWTGQRVTNEKRGRKDRIDLVERAVRSGHIVGNHTSTHAQLCSVSKTVAASEIDANATLFEELTGLPLFLMRVPYGARCKRLDKMLATREITHLHWDLDPQEFRHRNPELAFRYVTNRLRRLQPGMRAVLLMHDTQPATAKSLPKILDWIAEENERRGIRGKRPIRIISGSKFVEEKYPVPLLRWTRASLRKTGTLLTQAAHRLVPRP